MRRLLFFSFLMICCFSLIKAQQNPWILPPADSAFGEFTEWQKISVAFTDGRSSSYEYRIALMKYKNNSCYYELKIKNTSSKRTKFRVKTRYFDRIEDDSYGEKQDIRIKPDATATFHMIANGCRPEKNEKDIDDFHLCLSCGIRYDIIIVL